MSSLFVSSYLIYLKNQLMNIQLNDLSIGMNLTSNNSRTELLTDLKSNVNKTISLDHDNDDIFSIENDDNEDLRTNNQTLLGKQQELCFNSNNKLNEIGFSLYKLFEINRKSIEYRNDITHNNELFKRQKNNLLPFFDHSQHKLMINIFS